MVLDRPATNTSMIGLPPLPARLPAVSLPETSLPNIGSCIFYDQPRYTGPLALEKRARTDWESFADKIKLFLADSFLRFIREAIRFPTLPQSIDAPVPFSLRFYSTISEGTLKIYTLPSASMELFNILFGLSMVLPL